MAACSPRIGIGNSSSRPRSLRSRRIPKREDMPFKVELSPFERIFIGESVIMNSSTRTSFLIEGEAPVLREKNTLTAETANTPVKRLYFCVQTMYLKNDIPRYWASYLALVTEMGESGPGFGELFAAISGLISDGSLYKALKEIRIMVKLEDVLLEMPA
jgi:flagellar protein FlbT